MLSRSLFILVLILTFLFITSCFESNHNGGVKEVFEIRDLGFNYDFQDIYLFIWAEVFDPEGNENIETVNFYFYKIDDSLNQTLIDSGLLKDDGSNGDIIANDGVYSKKIKGIELEEGEYKLVVTAMNKSGEKTEKGEFSKYISINTAPELYILQAPESFEKGDTLVFKIRASDPQGLDDIASVRYFIKLPTGEIKTDNTWVLRDDGQVGDEVAGDGIYTVYQPSNKNSKLQGIFVFYFYAQDLSGLFSDTIAVSIKNPGVTLLSPNGGECYQIGDTINVTWESAFILQLKLEVIVDGMVSKSIDTVSAALKKYNWVVPDNFSSSSNCKIKVSDINKTSRFDESDETFSIGQCN